MTAPDAPQPSGDQTAASRTSQLAWWLGSGVVKYLLFGLVVFGLRGLGWSWTRIGLAYLAFVGCVLAVFVVGVIYFGTRDDGATPPS